MICYPETTAATEESLDQRHIIARILEVGMSEIEIPGRISMILYIL
jgi:hypothetical protein